VVLPDLANDAVNELIYDDSGFFDAEEAFDVIETGDVPQVDNFKLRAPGDLPGCCENQGNAVGSAINATVTGAASAALGSGSVAVAAVATAIAHLAGEIDAQSDEE